LSEGLSERTLEKGERSHGRSTALEVSFTGWVLSEGFFHTQVTRKVDDFSTQAATTRDATQGASNFWSVGRTAQKFLSGSQTCLHTIIQEGMRNHESPSEFLHSRSVEDASPVLD